MRSPEAPTKEEIEQRMVSHVPYRSWCPSCVRCRGQNTPHRQLDAEQDHALPTLVQDYGFLGRDDTKAMPVLYSKDFRTKVMSSHLVPCKGLESVYA
eukprot:10670449-Heterocapsa_arctica.AAC.1